MKSLLVLDHIISISSCLFGPYLIYISAFSVSTLYYISELYVELADSILDSVILLLRSIEIRSSRADFDHL